MKFGKKTQLNYKWRWVELTEEEVDEAKKELLEMNAKELKEIKKKVSSDIEMKILADKSLTPLYTYLDARLNQKIQNISYTNSGITASTNIKKEEPKEVPKSEPSTSEHQEEQKEPSSQEITVTGESAEKETLDEEMSKDSLIEQAMKKIGA